jgi:ActR/RegA family two-component response regulator
VLSNVAINPMQGAAAALIIEDDWLVAESFGRSLRSAGFGVTVANSGSEGIALARLRQFAVIVLELRLPDISGLEVLRTLSAARNHTRLVVVSGYLTVRLTIEAIKLGASDVLEKPVSAEQLVRAVATPTFVQALAEPEPVTAAAGALVVPDADTHNHSVAHRWAADIVKGCAINRDSKTLADWARRIGTSSTMICERCSMLDIKPHDARDLMRALFAMMQGQEQRCAPHVLLDIADARTLQTFRKKAGPAFQATRDPDAINRFLDSQSFVDPHNYGLTILRSLLARMLSAGAA